MTKQQLTEEFIQEITTGRRSVSLQHILDNLSEELINAAYLDAIDITQTQIKSLSGLALEASFPFTANLTLHTLTNALSQTQQIELSNQFQTLLSLLALESNNMFFVKVEGNSMINANIHSGDILIASKTTVALSNAIVVAKVNENYYIKRYKMLRNEE